jgi:hypothetical protein
MSILSRFHAKYFVDTNGCWIWTASKLKSGYGIFTDTNRRSVSAHKWSYIHFNGAVPDGFVIDHICRQTSCVNPAHLQAITQSENVKRSLAIQARGARTHCANGHEYTPANTAKVAGRRGRICLACRRK